MKSIKDKQILVGADIAGVLLKDAIVEQLEFEGWTVTDIGVKSIEEKNPEMFHRIGLKVGAKIANREFERALIFCGTGMGIHIAASKCPHVHAAVVESYTSALRCITGNDCNVMAMGGHYMAHSLGIQCAKAFLENGLGEGYDYWPNFFEFHKFAYDELEAFNYEDFKKNGFQFENENSVPLDNDPKRA